MATRDEDEDGGYQTNAADDAQVAYAEQKAHEATARERELWRWVLSQKMGREFLHAVVLAELGVSRHITTDTAAETYRDVALHNLGCRWLGRIVRHRDLYLQMLMEASKRDDEARREMQTARQQWAAREAAGG